MNEGDVVLTQDQVQTIRIMMDRYRDGEDPEDGHRLFLMLEYILAMRR